MGLLCSLEEFRSSDRPFVAERHQMTQPDTNVRVVDREALVRPFRTGKDQHTEPAPRYRSKLLLYEAATAAHNANVSERKNARGS